MTDEDFEICFTKCFDLNLKGQIIFDIKQQLTKAEIKYFLNKHPELLEWFI
jgi:hypothetical protein